MIDQSDSVESYNISDPNNQRFQAINGFYKTLNGEGEVIFSAYARNGKLKDDTLTILNNDFSSEWDEETAKKMLDLTHTTGGTSCMYDAIYKMINYMAARPGSNKSLVVLARNKDDGKSAHTLDEVIQLAKDKNIKINLIWMIKNYLNVNFDALRKLPSKTGGFLVYNGYVYQLSTVFLGLKKILRNEYKFYRFRATLLIDSPDYFADAFRDGIKIYYYSFSSYYIWNYVPFYLEKPN
ncbi:MAG: VWA domain-containing protein [Bacteroidia bacterium]|nr:VWA domain-containing protein [Bacteroidia bacterium]